MPVGYGPKCGACNSQHREGIDRRLLGGDSTRSVEAWLVEQGDKVSKSTLANHKAEHLNVLDEARARLTAAQAAKAVAAVNKSGGKPGTTAKRKAAIAAVDGVKASQPHFNAAVEKIIANADMLDWIASEAKHVASQLRTAMLDPTQAQAATWEGALKIIRGAVTDRHELLYGKKVQLESDSAEPRKFIVELSHPTIPKDE